MRNVEEAYFEWLYSQVGTTTDRNPAHTYWGLCEQLHKLPFRAFLEGDQNRDGDGRALRETYAPGVLSPHRPASWFEVLVALSARLAFQSSGFMDWVVGDWFWHLIANMSLDSFTDDTLAGIGIDDGVATINYVMEIIVERRYEYDGRGGIFPLENPQEDQRDVELWYQMSSYLLERFDFV